VVVVDESSTYLGMAPRYARAPRGQRAYVSRVRKRSQNISLLAALNLEGMSAPLMIEGGVTSAVFETYMHAVLLPTLHPGDIILLDNLRVHKSKRVQPMAAERGVKLLFLPAYSPDFSPIENAFAKLKNASRFHRPATFDELLDAVAQILPTISPYDAIGFFTNAGFLNLD
jgi:transposase